MVYHHWLVGRPHHGNCPRDDLASARPAMNLPIYHVPARTFFFFVLSLGFLFLCFLDWVRKKRITLVFNFVVALAFAAFLLFVTWFGLP
jgi:hypothetical protein